MFDRVGLFSWGELRLEEYLECELRVEWFAGAYAGGSVEVADGVVEGEVATDGYVAAAGGGEVIAVEEVEHLSTELKSDALFDPRVLEDREIDVGVSRAIVAVATSGAEGAWIGIDEGIWIVSFMSYDLGFIDLEQKTLQPLDNPFGPRLSPIS